MNAYARFVQVSSALLIVLGFAMLVYTAAHGGGVGLVIGVLFVAAGAGRLTMLRRRR